MDKNPQTLYEQLRAESASEPQAQNTTTATLRWVILGVATLLLTALLPGSGGEAEQGSYDQTLMGTTWSQEEIKAEYSFPVPKPLAMLDTQRDSARRSAPMVFIYDQAAADTLAGRLLKARLPKYVTDVGRDSIVTTAIIVRHQDGSEHLIERSAVVALHEVPTLPAATLLHSAEATEQLRNEMSAAVASTKEIVRKGDVIVRKGQRIDERTLLRLAGYRNAQFLRSNVRSSVLAALGSLGHAAMIIGFVALFLYFLRPVSFRSLGQLGTLVSLPVLTAFMGWMSVRLDPVLPFEYAIVVPALAMIITIMYEERTALMLTIAMSVAVGASRGDDYSILLVLIIGGMLGVYSARNIHSRTQIFTSIVAIFIGLVFAVVVIDLERSAPVQWMWPKIVMAAANAVASPLITFGVIMLFERAFNVATDLRLEEFNNLNHPLLRSLNEKAPGTYQHTLAVARLSEAAAQAIGANILLVRVGAFFHDIGKIEKSEYFVENQIDIGNKHDRLQPKKSAAIIRQHVQVGLGLAREYRLPERIWRFIPMHHGTILIKHFYALARAEAKESGGTVDEKDFRYPGPKPDTREAGIVMLADAAEALARLVDTTQRDQIANAIDGIILDRLTDGQLSNTNLTMRDLENIKEAFVKNLLGTSHSRIRYRGVPEPTSSNG